MAWREPFQVSFRVAEMENGVRVLIGVLAVGFRSSKPGRRRYQTFLIKKIISERKENAKELGKD